jgi:hypothetical protein
MAPSAPRKRQPKALTKTRAGWLIIAALSTGLTVVLATLEVPHVSVMMKVIATDVQLAFDDGWTVHDVPSTRVSFSNVEALRFTAEQAQHTTRAARTGPVSVAPADGLSGFSGSVTGDDLRLTVAIPPKSGVVLAVDGGRPLGLVIKVAGGNTVSMLETGREVRLSCNACLVDGPAAAERAQPAGAPLALRPDPREVELRGGHIAPIVLSTKLPDGESVVDLTIGQGLRIASLRFERDGGQATASSLAGAGSIYFPGLNTPPVELQPGDAVRLVPARPLALRRMTIDRTIRVELEGAVRELSSGPPGALRSRMPTVLGFVYANRIVQLMLGAALALISAVSGVLYRLGFLSSKDA